MGTVFDIYLHFIIFNNDSYRIYSFSEFKVNIVFAISYI